MNRHALLPLAVFFIGAGFVLAGPASTPVARSFPWAGFLEENGFAVTGRRQIGINLFTAAQQTTPCDTAVFADVEVTAGRFHVVFEAVPESCLVGGQLFFDMAVGPVGGARTNLAAASGNHTRLHAVPFASANDVNNRFTVGTGGRVVFEHDGGQTSLTGVQGQTGVSVQPNGTLANGQAVFAVRDATGTERLRVESNNRVLVNERLDVTGALSAGHVATLARVLFPSAGGVNNDPGAIEHVENGNNGELWLSSSDEWNGSSDNDRVVFGDRQSNSVQHEFDSAGNALHRGDLTVGGALSSTCPTGMTFVAGWCIDNTRGNNGIIQTYNQSMRFCHNQGKMLCPYDALAACDELQPSTSDCRTKTNEDLPTVLWSSTRQSDRGNFEAQYNLHLMCYRNGKIDECDSNESHDYYCCSHAYSGTP